MQVFVKGPSKKKTKESDTNKHTFESASANAIDALRRLPLAESFEADERPGPIFNASPQALRNLPKPDGALSPPPAMVELTDILLDAWSMTSITERMPGRPEVGPWLRGIADQLPQTTIAWRAELDEPGFAELDQDDIEEWFDTHRVLTHETLSVPTSSKSEGSAEKWLMARWEQLGKTLSEEERRRIGACPVVIDRAGLKVVPLADLIGELNHGNTSSIRGADLILPASFGGIEQGIGLLDAAAPKKPEDVGNADEPTRQINSKARLAAPDVADIAKGISRQREIVTKPEDGGFETHVIGSGTKPSNPARFVVELASDDEQTVRLISSVSRREKLDWGTIRQYLHDNGDDRGHVECVCRYSYLILKQLGMQGDNPVGLAVKLAAAWHDHGKDRERWQRCAGRLPGEPPLGKSGGKMRRDPRGYRHEFGSLREFTDAFKAGELRNDAGNPVSQDVFDLAAHLIATHHGRGRPHFPKGGFDPNCESRSDEIHSESIRRFARLQRKYGWWRLAWLENLLRCADALASADD